MVEKASADRPFSDLVQRFDGATAAPDRLHLRNGNISDLGAVNSLIQSAIGTWTMAERVKRISAPLYLYDELDLEFQQMLVAQGTDGDIVGVASWEPADPLDAPAGHSALLLHAIYVAPALHHQGIGSRLLEAAEAAALFDKFDALLVKAQPGAELFFVARGYEKLPVIDPLRNYPHRYWKTLAKKFG